MRQLICVVAAALACATYGVSADEEPQLKQNASVDLAAITQATSRSTLLGVDADGDGIRDDIEAIVANSEVEIESEESRTSATEAALAALSERKTLQKSPPRRTCMEYMLMGGKARARTDLRMQQRTSGAIGTHPCDPVVSPLLERPFETDFLHLDLGPASLRY